MHAAPTHPTVTATGTSLTPFCAYANDPAAVAPVTATTAVPTMCRASYPSFESAGMKTTAPPRPVTALTEPANPPLATVKAPRASELARARYGLAMAREFGEEEK